MAGSGRHPVPVAADRARNRHEPAEAQARVIDVQTRMRAALEKAKSTAKQAADDARKAAAYAALWLFITLLIGAFFASLSATWAAAAATCNPPTVQGDLP